MDELLQKSLGSYKHYKILKDRIVVTTKNINKYEEFYIKLDNLGLDLSRRQTRSILILIPFYIGLTVLATYVLFDEYQKGVRFPQLLFWIFGALMFGTGAVYSFFQKTDKVFIQGGAIVLQLNGSNPDRETVDNFINSLQTAIKSYYKTKYALIDPTLNEETQIHNYKWLQEIGAVTNDEFEELLNNLKLKNLLT
ncbi:hypothetical protein [Solitalea lacus]|uniref:hypothetical protein n=1 Tax=Solitalea lacus TaxID=2911172 RepID=UPI001EDA7A60|nr:hypothetical protein [Solitalea lacus]UKJ07014.1 hypothetical protein L2B55_15980 [Solitalea lacus]